MERISFCKKCGKDFDWRRKYCPHCGQHEDRPIEPDPPPCEHCASRLPKGSTYCQACLLEQGQPIRHRFTKVMGTTFANRDGSDRQIILARLADRYPQGAIFEQCRLDREPDNPADPQAVAVVRSNGERLGYLTRGLAAEVCIATAVGCNFGCYLLEVTGGYVDAPTLGANLLVLHYAPRVTAEEARAYFREHRLRDRA